MKGRMALFALAILFFIAQSTWAADINGKWVAQVPQRSGKPRQTTFDFKVEDTKLTGTVSGAFSHILEGQVNVDEISFVVVVKAAGAKIGYSYKGKISGNEIKFTRTRSIDGSEKVEFTARRARQ